MKLSIPGRLAYLVIPHLPVAVERRERPRLVNRPVIVASAADQVLDCSSEAIVDRVRPGLPLRQAEQLCPEGIFLPPRLDLYRAVATELFALLSSQLSSVEQAQPGGLYLGLAGLEQQDTDALAICRQQGEAIARELRLAATAGVAANKFTAEAASLSIGLNRALVLTPGTERDFLQDFPVTLLPVNTEVHRRLHLFGLRRLGQFAHLPQAAVLAQFGWEGQQAQRLARGQDDRPLIPGRSEHSETIGTEFEPALDNLDTLIAAAEQLAGQLAQRLTPEFLRADRIDLRVDCDDGTQISAQRFLAEPTADAGRLGRVVEALLRSQRYPDRITHLHLTLSGLQAPSVHQLCLWHNPQEEAAQTRLKQLAVRYGHGCFQRGVLVDPEQRLAERRFVQVGLFEE